MTKAHDYNITIRKAVIEDEELFEARIRELPDVTEFADTAEEAYALAIDTIETTAQILRERGKTMPSPYVPADDYSGRVTLRLPRTLHRAISEAAESDGVSLNQYIVGVLTYITGIAHGAAALEARANAWKPSNVINFLQYQRTRTGKLRISETRDLSSEQPLIEVYC